MNSTPMKHLGDEELLDAYYGDLDSSEHLSACVECRDRLDRLTEVLDAFKQFPIPPRDSTHGQEMWMRVVSRLPLDTPRSWWRHWWILIPALAAVLTITFMAGRLTERSQTVGISEEARERVLLMSLNEHLEQSQIILANVVHANPGSADLAYERDRAHELLGANRLLRQTAVHLGDLTDAALLDDLERVLLDVANSPERLSAGDLERTKQQIGKQGLLFRVRIASAAIRRKETL